MGPIRRGGSHTFPASHRTWATDCQQSHWGRRFEDWLNQHKTVIELAEAADARRYPNLQIPDWLRTLTRAWLVIPLIHRDLLQGFIVLGESRTNRPLDWEDYELLMAIGRQAASYIAEEQSANALSESRQLQLISRRFAFVAHDLKNIVGQLTLMLRNAERFKDNAQFRDDMVETIIAFGRSHECPAPATTVNG